MSIDLVMPSNHLILCHPLLLPSIIPSIRVFSNESALRIRWPKYCKTQNCQPHGRAVLLGSLTSLLSAQAPCPNKFSCFVSTCVSSGNSLLSIRQEHSFGSWKRSHFLQHRYTICGMPFVLFEHCIGPSTTPIWSLPDSLCQKEALFVLFCSKLTLHQ